MTKTDTALIFTDGSCRYTPDNRSQGPCGWAFIIVPSQDKEAKIIRRGSGFISGKTHNYAELYAVKEALKMVHKSTVYKYFDIYSDSRYCVDGVNTNMHAWRKNKFNKLTHSNLWKEVYNLFEVVKHRINIIWLSAHNGNIHNEFVDAMAKKAIDDNNSAEVIASPPAEYSKAIDYVPYLDKDVVILVGDKEKAGKLFSINTVKNTIGLVYPNNFEFVFYLDNGNVSLKK